MDYLKLTSDKLDLTEINDLVAHETCGAISLFVGTTRDNFEEKTVGANKLPLTMQLNNSITTIHISGRFARVRGLRANGLQSAVQYLCGDKR